MKVLMLGNSTKDEVENRVKIVASAGNLSRANETVTEVYNSRNDYEKNLKLIKLILNSGHKSILEHDYLVFAIEDVTPIIEQIIISYRLTSFTIKSRRNVDFRNAGFYTPDFKDKNSNFLHNKKKIKNIYNNYMQSLFNKYGELNDEGIPIEDARFILPYSYHSNIIMGCDAHELIRMTCDLLYGKNSNITEVKEFATKLKNKILEYAPYLSEEFKKEENKNYYKDNLSFVDKYVNNNELKGNEESIDKVTLLDYTENGDFKVLVSALQNRYDISYEEASILLYE